MANNFYDLETDLEVEDVEENEDGFEDTSDFGDFDREEAESKWGSMDFQQLVAELENTIAVSKKFFFSKKKRVVDGEEMTHLIQFIQAKLPNEIAQARGIISNRDSIINSARQEEASIVASAKNYYKTTTQSANDDADNIIKRAQAQAEEMVAAHSITQAARVRAEEIKDNCQKQMNDLIGRTTADCEAHKENARNWAVSVSQGSYNFVCDALSQYQSIAMNNLNQITEVYKQFQTGFDSHMKGLDANADVKGGTSAADAVRAAAKPVVARQEVQQTEEDS